LLHIIQSITKGDDVKGFQKAVFATVAHGATNTGRSLSAALFRKRSKGGNLVGYYESQLSKLSANFALCSDFALTMGGKLKSAEFTSGRFADVLSNLFLGYATLWHYSKYPVAGADKVVEYAMENILFETEEAFFSIFDNFPVPVLGTVMRNITFPTGRCYSRPNDDLIRAVSNAITTETAVRKQFEQDLFISSTPGDRVGLIIASLPKVIAADKIRSECRKQKRVPTAEEEKVLKVADVATEEIIQVDSFARLGVENTYEPAWTASARPAYGSKVLVGAHSG